MRNTIVKRFNGVSEYRGKLVSIIKERSVLLNDECKIEADKKLKEINEWFKDLQDRSNELKFTSTFGCLMDQKLMENIYLISWGGYPYTSHASIKYVHTSGTCIDVRSSASVDTIVRQVNKVLNEYTSIDEYIVSYLEKEIKEFETDLSNLKKDLLKEDLSKGLKEKLLEEIIDKNNDLDDFNGKLFSIQF